MCVCVNVSVHAYGHKKLEIPPFLTLEVHHTAVQLLMVMGKAVVGIK